MNKYKKQMICAFIIVIILFVLSIILISYVISNTPGKIDKKLSVNYTPSSSIKIDNSLPISDTLGKNITESNINQGYVEFTVKNDNDEDVNFQVFITKLNQEDEAIKGNYIKYYLTDNNNVPVDGFEKNLLPTYDNLYYLNDKPSSKLLYNGKIKANSRKKLILRVWVSDSYALSDTKDEFSFTIGVKGK